MVLFFSIVVLLPVLETLEVEDELVLITDELVTLDEFVLSWMVWLVLSSLVLFDETLSLVVIEELEEVDVLNSWPVVLVDEVSLA
jgi:hypothetical protein